MQSCMGRICTRQGRSSVGLASTRTMFSPHRFTLLLCCWMQGFYLGRCPAGRRQVAKAHGRPLSKLGGGPALVLIVSHKKRPKVSRRTTQPTNARCKPGPGLVHALAGRPFREAGSDGLLCKYCVTCSFPCRPRYCDRDCLAKDVTKPTRKPSKRMPLENACKRQARKKCIRAASKSCRLLLQETRERSREDGDRQGEGRQRGEAQRPGGAAAASAPAQGTRAKLATTRGGRGSSLPLAHPHAVWRFLRVLLARCSRLRCLAQYLLALPAWQSWDRQSQLQQPHRAKEHLRRHLAGQLSQVRWLLSDQAC